MGEKEIIEINKNGWNELVRSGKNYSNTSLPEYGPFMRNEEYFNIFSEKKQVFRIIITFVPHLSAILMINVQQTL